MITILTGDKVSAGDALIVDRGMRLLKHLLPGEELLKLKRWKPIEPYVDDVNQSKAVVLLGGPAVEPDIYPGIYPLVQPLDRIRVPIVAMGLGSCLFPFNKAVVSRFRFTDASRLLLSRLERDGRTVSVRDYLTARILRESGLSRVRVTGCPAWFNLETLGSPIKAPQRIATVAFATGVSHIFYRVRGAFEQQVGVMKTVSEMLPGARRLCVFQDSLENDDQKPLHMRQQQRALAKAAEAMGYEIVDGTFNLDAMIEAYRHTDLLVGYRVHSHICMLSQGKPSILIMEDSRGHGLNDFVGLRPIAAHEGPQRWFHTLSDRSLRARALRRLRPMQADPDLPQEVRRFLEQDLEGGFTRYGAVHQVILHYYKIMADFVRTIPG